jgi:hypothetical protein
VSAGSPPFRVEARKLPEQSVAMTVGTMARRVAFKKCILKLGIL